MAKKLNAKTLLELLERSKLLRADQLQRAAAEVASQQGSGLPEDAELLADYLVAAQLVTRWQADNLLRGKYKGYFLGKFRLLGLLGSGGMSSVYLAEHTLMRRKQAIKVLPKKRVADASYLERFKLEALATAALDHPNIVRVYDIDQEGDIHYLVMEYVPGRDLQAIVASEGPLDFVDAARYVAQAARGLQYAHDARLIHRDVKPANLLLDDQGAIKILDLGLALYTREGEASLTLLHNENVLGTADYLAPEQALSSHDVDSRVDIYSLGCTLYFLLTGQPPFPTGTLAQRIAKHQSTPPPDIRGFRSNCPAALLTICVKMMQKDPTHRYLRMQEVADALESWLRTQETVPLVLDGQRTPPRIPLRTTAQRDAPATSTPVRALGSGSDVLRNPASNAPAHPVDDTPGATGPAAPTDRLSSGTLRDADPSPATSAATSAAVAESGRLDLGIEVFSGASSSQGARLRLEQRHSREQRLTFILRWAWILVAAVALCMISVLVGTWLLSDNSSTPSPAYDNYANPPVLRPRADRS